MFLSWLALASACSTQDSGADAAPHASVSEQAGFRNPSECATCHPTHYAEWRTSSHAYALRDPVFRAMVRLGQRETQGKLGDFCLRCHSPIASETGQAQPYLDDASGEHVQDFDSADEIAAHGVSCDGCHTVDSVITTANAKLTLDPLGPRRATIADPVEGAAHASEHSPLHEGSRFCGACHQVVNPFFREPIALEETYGEWVRSAENGSRDCQDCHMQSYRGRAAESGPERDVHRHTFEGVDVSLLPPRDFPGYEEQRALSEALLRRTFQLTLEPQGRMLQVAIHNFAGHSVPSGATADRELWIELLVRDAKGKRVLESGTLDANGDLRDGRGDDATAEPDPQLFVLRQIMRFDPALEDPNDDAPAHEVHFLWEPNTEESKLIRSRETLRPVYDLSKLPAGRYRAEVRVLIRAFAPRILRELEKRADLDPDVRARMPTVEMASKSVELVLP